MTSPSINSKDDPTGLVTDESQGNGLLSDATAAIAEFTEAVALIEAAILGVDEHAALMKGSIDDHVALAKGGIDDHVALAKGSIDDHIAIQKGCIDTHVALAKSSLDQHATAAVTAAVQSNMQTIVNAVLDALRRQGL